MADKKKSVAVYLGSHEGNDPSFMRVAREFGRYLARGGYRLIYGGASVGTMGALANGCMEEGGECIGVFPVGFKGKPEIAAEGGEVAKKDLSRVIECANFKERKQIMEDESDCCVALPGSWGTLDELFTYASNSELKFNGGKKLFVLNSDGYFNPLKEMISNMYRNGFIQEYSTHLITFCDNLDELMGCLAEI